MFLETINSLGSEPLLENLEKMNGIPILGDPFDEKKFDLVSFLTRGFSNNPQTNLVLLSAPIINLYVYVDPRNSTAYVIKVSVIIRDSGYGTQNIYD